MTNTATILESILKEETCENLWIKCHEVLPGLIDRLRASAADTSKASETEAPAFRCAQDADGSWSCVIKLGVQTVLIDIGNDGVGCAAYKDGQFHAMEFAKPEPPSAPMNGFPPEVAEIISKNGRTLFDTEPPSAAANVPSPSLAQKVAGALGFILADYESSISSDARAAAQKILDDYRAAANVSESGEAQRCEHGFLLCGLCGSPPAPAPVSSIESGDGDAWFAYDPISINFETFATADEAIKAASETLDYAREQAPDGWPEETNQICWGRICGGVYETERRPTTPDDPCHSDCTEFVEYALETDSPTPAPASGGEGVTDAEFQAAWRVWLQAQHDCDEETVQAMLEAASRARIWGGDTEALGDELSSAAYTALLCLRQTVRGGDEMTFDKEADVKRLENAIGAWNCRARTGAQGGESK